MASREVRHGDADVGITRPRHARGRVVDRPALPQQRPQSLLEAVADARIDLTLTQEREPVLDRILLSTAGMLVMISAGDLIALYVGLELSSLALYVVAAYRRDSLRASEAGLKYFVLGALSSGMLLYGSSLSD